MNLFRRSFTAKILGTLLVVGAVLVVAMLVAQEVFFVESVPLSYGLYGVIALFSLVIVLFWMQVSRPLREIIVQMEALITGHEYKKFFTDRVDEIGVLAHFFNEVTKNLHQFTRKLVDGDRMASELDVASKIQRDILPTEAPRIPGLVIAAKTRPAAEVGGDSFDFLTAGDATYMYIGDATGHGVPAGIVMTIVNTLVYVYAETSSTLLDLMIHVNRHLKDRIQKTLFMSMVMLKWDHLKRQMSFVGAGHEYILVYRAKSGVCEAIPSGGVALGMVADNSKVIKESVISLDEGDSIVLYTDGIVECRNPAGQLFGLDKLKALVCQYVPAYTPDLALQKIAAELGSFMQEHPQDDDMTLIIINNSGNLGATPAALSLKTSWSE